MIHNLNRDARALSLSQLSPAALIKTLVLLEVSLFLSSGIYLQGLSLVQLLPAKAQS